MIKSIHLQIFLNGHFVVLLFFVCMLAGCGTPEPPAETVAPTVAATAAPAVTPTITPALSGMGKVTITWGTETEQECYGFNVFRASTPEGPFEKANKKLIRGAGTTHVPQRYRIEDQPLPMGQTFYYKVQQIDLSGEKRDITPVVPCKVTQPVDAAETKTDS